LGAILLVTGIKLFSPTLVKKMWHQGRYQFAPFALTVTAIVLTDLMVGVLIGMAVATGFILKSSVQRPLRRIVEKHLGGEVVHIELADQVSFLNRAALAQALDNVPPGGHVLLDARSTDYIDPDLLSLICDFKDHTAPARNVEASLLGFHTRYELRDRTQYVDYSTLELQTTLDPKQALQILKDGHERFRSGRRLVRDLGLQLDATAGRQYPLAVVVSCIDSRTPPELIFDLGVGDIFSVRIAGNVSSRKILGSVEYACAIAGAKLVLVMGHTRCGAVTAAVDLMCSAGKIAETTGCQHLEHIVHDIQQSVDATTKSSNVDALSPSDKEILVNAVARRNVSRTVATMLNQSQTLNQLVRDGRIAVMGSMYDVGSREVSFQA
jgi:carbonic anhydrase/SulP family sulfate permease